MSEIVVTELREADYARWAELWRSYLDFYETSLPEAIYRHTWRRIMDATSIFGFGARLGDPGGHSSASPTISSTTMPGRQSKSAICKTCLSMRACAAKALAGR